MTKKKRKNKRGWKTLKRINRKSSYEQEKEPNILKRRKGKEYEIKARKRRIESNERVEECG